MKTLFLAIVAMLAVGGCANIPTETAEPQMIERVCWRFGGRVHCPPTDGSEFILPCDTPSAVYEVPQPILPPPPKAREPMVVGVINPTDLRGRPMAQAEVCSQYGCTGVRTPAAMVQYPVYHPYRIWQVIPPPKACAKGIGWEPTRNYMLEGGRRLYHR